MKKIFRNNKGTRYVPPPDIRQLPVDAINNLPAETIEQLPDDRLEFLPPEALNKLSTKRLESLPPDLLARLLPQTLARLPSIEAFQRVPPRTLSTLDIKNLQKLPPKLIAPAIPYLELDAVKKIRTDVLALALCEISEESARDIRIDILNQFPKQLRNDIFLQISPHVLSRYNQDGIERIRRLVAPAPLPKMPADSALTSPYETRVIPGPSIPPLDFEQPLVNNEHIPERSIMPPRQARQAQGGNREGPPTAWDTQNSSRHAEWTAPPSPLSNPSVGRESYLNRTSSKRGTGRRDSHDVMSQNQAKTLPGMPRGMSNESVQLQDETRRTPDIIRAVNDGRADFNGGNGSTDRLADLSGEIKGKDLYIAQLLSDSNGLRNEVLTLKTQNALAEEKKNRADDIMFKCLKDVKPETAFDRLRDDPVTLLDQTCREFYKNAIDNLAIAETSHRDFKLEYERRQTVDRDLLRTRKELRTAEDNLSPLKREIDDLREVLGKAEITIAESRNEINQRETKVVELETRLDRQKQKSAARQSEVQQQHEAQTQALSRRVRDLQNELDTQKEDLAQKIKQHLDSYNRDRQKLEDRLAAQQSQFEAELDEREGELGKLIEQERVVHEKEMEGQRAAHKRELLRQENEHKRNLVDLRATVKNLEGDLVDNSDDFRPASDDALKVRFKDIKLTIETITSPFNIRATTIPEGVDPDGFLVRESKSKLCFLLRSIVWSKLVDGFFSSPFGFGALGTGDGARMLVALYSSWRRLFDAASLAAPDSYPREQIFERFRTDKEANKWRSSTFQSILMTVHPKGQKKGVSGAEAVRPYADNCNRVQSEILDLFVKVIGRGAAEELEIKVDTIVSLASELALEFGSQRAQLGLQMPNRGESIQMGPDFEDCEDGAGTHGTIEEVDLAISPKLYRIGDGRNDLTTRKTIVAGEIYPLRS